MKDLIKLKSRGYEENYLKKLKKPDGSESKTYVLILDVGKWKEAESSLTYQGVL